MLLLPQPLGPTRAVIPGIKVSVTLSENDLNPVISAVLILMVSAGMPYLHCKGMVASFVLFLTF
jgi:hypothetical protein